MAKNIKQNSECFYGYVRSKMKRKDKVGPLIDDSGETVTDDMETAKILNDYFGSVFTKENTTNIPRPIKLFCGKDEESLTDIICNIIKSVS